MTQYVTEFLPLKDGLECLLFWENFDHSPLIILNLHSRKRAEHLPFMPINSDWSKLRVGCRFRYWNPLPQTWMYYDGSCFLQYVIIFLLKSTFSKTQVKYEYETKNQQMPLFQFYSYIDGSLHVSGPQAHPQESSHSCSHNQWLCEQLCELSRGWACGPETCRDPSIYE